MRKIYKRIINIVLCCLLCFGGIYLSFYLGLYAFFTGLAFTIDYVDMIPEKRIKEQIANGEIKLEERSNEVKLVWGDNYIIYPSYESYDRIHFIDKGEDKGPVSDYVTYYTIWEDRLYLETVEGYIVIDKDNTCHVIVTAEWKKFFDKRQFEKDPPLFYTGRLNHKLVKYYNFFRDLTDKEQNFLFDIRSL